MKCPACGATPETRGRFHKCLMGKPGDPARPVVGWAIFTAQNEKDGA